jgi:uncharacterized protein (DUF1501 family)
VTRALYAGSSVRFGKSARLHLRKGDIHDWSRAQVVAGANLTGGPASGIWPTSLRDLFANGRRWKSTARQELYTVVQQRPR